jgi:hypothetical protein
MGRERESVNVPENPVDCQKRETFPVVSHPPTSSFSPLSFSKNGRRKKGQDSPGLHEFVSLFPARSSALFSL